LNFSLCFPKLVGVPNHHSGGFRVASSFPKMTLMKQKQSILIQFVLSMPSQSGLSGYSTLALLAAEPPALPLATHRLFCAKCMCLLEVVT
jgi:hypothetical protein